MHSDVVSNENFNLEPIALLPLKSTAPPDSNRIRAIMEKLLENFDDGSQSAPSPSSSPSRFFTGSSSPLIFSPSSSVPGATGRSQPEKRADQANGKLERNNDIDRSIEKLRQEQIKLADDVKRIYGTKPHSFVVEKLLNAYSRMHKVLCKIKFIGIGTFASKVLYKPRPRVPLNAKRTEYEAAGTHIEGRYQQIQEIMMQQEDPLNVCNKSKASKIKLLETQKLSHIESSKTMLAKCNELIIKGHQWVWFK